MKNVVFIFLVNLSAFGYTDPISMLEEILSDVEAINKASSESSLYTDKYSSHVNKRYLKAIQIMTFSIQNPLPTKDKLTQLTDTYPDRKEELYRSIQQIHLYSLGKNAMETSDDFLLSEDITGLQYYAKSSISDAVYFAGNYYNLLKSQAKKEEADALDERIRILAKFLSEHGEVFEKDPEDNNE